MVFAQLCLNQHEVVINFLSGVTINGRNGLDIVLTSWTTYHSDFQGQYQQKVRYERSHQGVRLLLKAFAGSLVLSSRSFFSIRVVLLH